MSSAEQCPHCGHEWGRHTARCDCGCMWPKPKPPEPPKPPPDPLIAVVRGAIFAELDRQHEAGEIDGAGYWDSEWGCCDGEPNWGKVAEAVIAAVRASFRRDA